MKKSAITFTAGCLVLAGIAAFALGAQKLTPKEARDLALGRIAVLEMSMADFNLSEPARERMSRQISKLRTAIQEIALYGEVPKSFEQLADDAAKETDRQFCAKATTDWERKAFCVQPKVVRHRWFHEMPEPSEPTVEWVGLLSVSAEARDVEGRMGFRPGALMNIELGLAADGTLRWRERPK